MKLELPDRIAGIISFCIFLGVFGIVLFINMKTPVWSDDWAFFVSYQTQRLHSAGDVFLSIGYFYSHVNGRSLANLIAVLFAFLGKNILNFFNALAFSALAWSVYRLVSFDRKMRPLSVLGIFFLLWFFLPVPNQTMFWMCAAIVYLWMAVLAIFFLVPFRDLALKDGRASRLKDNFFSAAAIFGLGILTGNSHELLAPAVFLGLVFLGYCLFKRKQKIPRWFYTGFLGEVIGMAFQFAAPGNYQKFDNTAGGKNFLDLVGGISAVFDKALAYQAFLWGASAMIILLYLFNKWFLKRDAMIVDGIMIIMLFGAVILDAFGIFFPYFPPRALFFSSLALIIFISRFLLMREFVFLKALIVIVFIPVFVSSAYSSIIKSEKLYLRYQEREFSIADQKSRGERNIKVKKIKAVKDRMLLNDSLLPFPDNNLWASRYYEVDSINLMK